MSHFKITGYVIRKKSVKPKKPTVERLQNHYFPNMYHFSVGALTSKNAFIDLEQDSVNKDSVSFIKKVLSFFGTNSTNA